MWMMMLNNTKEFWVGCRRVAGIGHRGHVHPQSISLQGDHTQCDILCMLCNFTDWLFSLHVSFNSRLHGVKCNVQWLIMLFYSVLFNMCHVLSSRCMHLICM